MKTATHASRAIQMMEILHDPRYNAIYDNFLGDLIKDEYDAAKTNGTSAALSVTASQLTLTSGTDDNGYAGFGPSATLWKGDNGVYFESQQSLSSLTTQKMEIGLSDSSQDAGAVATTSTPTGTADDFCVLVFDTDDNTEFDLISEIDNGGPVANAEDVYTLVAGTDFVTEFKMQNDNVAVYVNATHVGSGSMQGGDLCTPWFFTQSRASSSSGVLTVEYLFACGGSGIAA